MHLDHDLSPISIRISPKYRPRTSLDRHVRYSKPFTWLEDSMSSIQLKVKAVKLRFGNIFEFEFAYVEYEKSP